MIYMFLSNNPSSRDINSFLRILLLKIVDFEKKLCTVCIGIGDFIGFSKFTGS